MEEEWKGKMPPETLKLHKEVEIIEYFISTNRDRLMATEVLKVVKKNEYPVMNSIPRQTKNRLRSK